MFCKEHIDAAEEEKRKGTTTITLHPARDLPGGAHMAKKKAKKATKKVAKKTTKKKATKKR